MPVVGKPPLHFLAGLGNPGTCISIYHKLIKKNEGFTHSKKIIPFPSNLAYV
jgi:hypothetical protein